jgi:hypothetical protein
MSLEHVIESARQEPLVWDERRSQRVLASALARRHERVVRNRARRRLAVGLAAAAAVVFLLLRGGNAPAGEGGVSPASMLSAPVLAVGEGVLAGDAGYARD